MNYETGNMNQKIGNKSIKIRIALAGLFCIMMGAVLSAMPLSAHAQATGGPVFITPFTFISGGITFIPWTTFNLPSLFPANATGVILEAEGAMSLHDERILIRKDSASPYYYVLLRGRAIAGGDAGAWAGQGVFPLSPNGTFQYAIEDPGFDGGATIRVIGYTTAPITFIAPTEIGNNTNTSSGWKTYANAGALIPPSATGVILEAEAEMSGPDYGDWDMHIKIRKDNVSPQYVLLRGRAAGSGSGGDNIGWANQGVFPVSSSGTFDYNAEPPGGGWRIRIVGYTTTTNVFIAPTEIESYVPSVYSVSGSHEGTSTTGGWITFNASNIIPGNSTGVILEAEAAMSGPNGGDVDAHIVIRKDTLSPKYTLLRGRSAGGGDSGAWAGQGVFPLSPNGTFQYAIEDPGFSEGWEIRIVGYVPGGDPPPICSTFGLERTTTYDLQDIASAYGYGVAVDSSNNTYITGEQYAPATGLDMYVNKYAANGALAWSAIYDVVTASGSGNESGYGIAVTPDGSAVYVAGRLQNDQFPDGRAFIRKYNGADGLLVTSFGSGGTALYDLGQTSARAVALDSAGNVYVVGHREKFAAGSGIDAVLLSYNSSGSPRPGFPAILNIATAYNSSALGIAVSGSSVYITGYVHLSSTDTDMFVGKYSTGGALSWSKMYQDTTVGFFGSDVENNTETGQGVSVDSSGNVFVTGYTSENGGHTFLRKYDSAGTVVWGEVRNSSGVPNDIGRGAVVGNSGRIFVTGRQQTNNEDAFLAEYYTDQTKITAYPDASSDIIPLCADGKIGFVYERQGSTARVYLAGFSSTDVLGSGCTGGDPGHWSFDTDGKKLFYEFDWNDIPAEITEFTAMVDANDYNDNAQSSWLWPASKNYNDWKGSATFTRSDTDKPVIGGTYLGADVTVATNCQFQSSSYVCTAYPGQPCTLNHPLGQYVCYPPPFFISTETLNLRMDIRWHSMLSGLADSVVRLYQGDKGGLTEYNEMAYGVAQTNSTASGHTTTSNDVYVVGYQTSGGGSAFLNKYSCSAGGAVATGESAIANFSATPASGVSPLTVHTDARASAGTITKYEWDWNYSGNPLTFSASASIGALASHKYEYAAPGTPYTIALRITTSGNVTAINAQDITVSPNQAPIAGFTVCDVNGNCATSEPPASASFAGGASPLRVNVDGATSYDPDELQGGGYVASFSWDWGDGTTPGVGEKATHQYFTPESYTIKLTVTDNGGLMSATATKGISVTEQYVCTSGSGPGGSCAGATPVCGPTETPGGTACYACLEDATCGIGYQCLGISCKQGDMCLPDADGNPVTCPVDGKCPELITCNPLASAATCPDGSACPASGMCAPAKNVCALSGSGVDTQCYVEEQGSCVLNSDCTESVTGGVCTATGACRYARCSNETGLACVTDVDCADSDGICNNNTCVYLYDCAYGPGMGGGVTGQYATSTPDTMPKMPLGIQPDGQACTQPTSDAPNNCEGINGCLYYNYQTIRGVSCATSACPSEWTCRSDKFCYQGGHPIPDSSNSVANCVNTFEGGTGCVHYQYYSPLPDTTPPPPTKTNCLPRYAEKSKKSPQAGIPEGCFVVDKGASGKEYNCTSIDGCYYYLDGSVDCTYTKATNISCTTSADCETASETPLMIPVCDTNLCEYQGNGCKYEPNPKGAISCPGAVNPATGGDNFVQCMLNPDGLLPGFLNTSASTLSSCNTNADCPPNNICLNGTCFPICQGDIDCAGGDQCKGCLLTDDCDAGLICDGNACVPPKCAGAKPSGTLRSTTLINLGLFTPTDSECRYSTSATTYNTMTQFSTTFAMSHIEPLGTLIDGSYAYNVLCQELSSSVLAPMCQIDFNITTPPTCVPYTTCTNGLPCTILGFCPDEPVVCLGATPHTPPNLLTGTLTTTIGLNTDTPQTCKYSDSWGMTYADMTLVFDTADGITHTKPNVPSKDGHNAYYARCYDTARDKYTPVCSIPFDQGCSSNTVGVTCITTGGTTGTCSSPTTTGASICVPECLNPIPDTPPNLLAGTLTTPLGLDTLTSQECRYSASVDAVYTDMTPFGTTGGITHAEPSVPSKDGYNVYYARCYDAMLGKYDQCSISFYQGCSSNTVGSDCVATGGTTGTCLPPDAFGLSKCTAICKNAYPLGTQTLGDIIPFGLETTNNSTCRYVEYKKGDPTTLYDNMTTSFSTSDGLNHSANTTVLSGDNTKYVGCRESSTPNPTSYCQIPYYGGPCTPFSCATGFGCNAYSCEDCTTNPNLPDCQPPGCDPSSPDYICCINPTNPLCVLPPPPPVNCATNPSMPGCENSCNTLGYTFTGTAIMPSGNCSLVALILALLSWIAWIIALLAVLSGLRAAYLYITSMGDERKLILARRYLIYTTIGVAVSVLSFSVVAITRAILNI